MAQASATVPAAPKGHDASSEVPAGTEYVTQTMREALRDAMLDRSVIVRQAAESSLQFICTALATQSESDDDDVSAATCDTEKALS